MASSPMPAWPEPSSTDRGIGPPTGWRAPAAAEIVPHPEAAASPGPGSTGPYRAELLGGVANAGHVFRIGDTVRRPTSTARRPVHRLLAELHRLGFEACPEVLGVDVEHEVLSFAPGRTANYPLPDWAGADDQVASVGRLIRRLHDACAQLVPSAPAPGWPMVAVPAPYCDGTVTHNDLHPGNIVFDGMEAVAVIDFDLAGPGGVAWDLAAVARYWSPLVADQDLPGRADGHRIGASSRFARLGLLLDSYGLTGAARTDVVDALIANHDWTYQIVVEQARRGHAGFTRHWRQIAGVATRARRWMVAHEADLRAAAR